MRVRASLLALALLAACRSEPEGHARLDLAADPLRSAFNAAADQTRVILIVAPG